MTEKTIILLLGLGALAYFALKPSSAAPAAAAPTVTAGAQSAPAGIFEMVLATVNSVAGAVGAVAQTTAKTT